MGIVDRIWDNYILTIIGYILVSLFYLTFAAALIKGWFETRSMKQVYKDNKFMIILLAIIYAVGLILLMLIRCR